MNDYGVGLTEGAGEGQLPVPVATEDGQVRAGIPLPEPADWNKGLPR
jgi:hypothetical protein